MTKQTEAMKLALEALVKALPDMPVHTDWHFEAITALREALAEQPAQQEQEPVAQEWRYYFSHSGATGKPDEVVGPCFTDRKEVAFGVGCFDQTALYPPAQRKPWVGLTDEDTRKINQEVWGYVSADHTRMWDYARAIEAKLREKNHG